MRIHLVPGSRGWDRRTSLLLAAIATAAVIAPSVSSAQPSAATHRVVASSGQHATQKRKSARRVKAEPAQKALVASTPAPPPPPPPPNWPVNDPPTKASVIWNAQGLSIDAKNSSLQEILNEISEQTGSKIEGMGQDQRVYGVYGPGQPQEVLSDLLEGSGYNVLMVGNAARGVPREIQLSERPQGGAQPNAPVSQGEMYEPPVAPYQPPQPIVQPNQPPSPRTPQQILQEMQQRQEQLREEQMRQQQMQQQQQDAPQQEQ